MHLDHISFAAGPDGLLGTAERLSRLLGESFVDGGVHPRFGTCNMVLPLTGGQYLEVVGALDHPASDKAPFGQAVKARSQAGGGWLGWVLAVDDIAMVARRLEREPVAGNRHRPDGVELRWRQVGVAGLQSDPQLPFFIHWEIEPDKHPSSDATGRVTLSKLEIGGEVSRVDRWLGASTEQTFDGLEVEWVAPDGAPGIVAATFTTPNGLVRI